MTEGRASEKFRPEKYGMLFCPNCGGAGRSLTGKEGFNVCKVCEGFGLLKKEGRRGFQNKDLTVQSFR